MQNEPYIASTYLKVLTLSDPALIAQLQSVLGKQIDKLLEADFIYANDIHRVFNAFASKGLDSWLLRYGGNLSVASHGPLGFAVLSAPDLNTAMQILADFSIIRSSTYISHFVFKENRAEFVVSDQLGGLAGQWSIETAISVVQKLIENIMGHRLGENAQISFAYPSPVYAEELELFYGAKCEFDAKETKISIPSSWCQIPSPLYEEATFKSNLAKCREAKLNIEGTQKLSEAVLFELEEFFEARSRGELRSHDLPTMESLAIKHSMSARTLSRKLKEQKSPYKQLLEEARRDFACKLLSDTHLTIADIAYNLAYQESANFVRAFKTWFDIPPAAWRRSQHKSSAKDN